MARDNDNENFCERLIAQKKYWGKAESQAIKGLTLSLLVLMAEVVTFLFAGFTFLVVGMTDIWWVGKLMWFIFLVVEVASIVSSLRTVRLRVAALTHINRIRAIIDIAEIANEHEKEVKHGKRTSRRTEKTK